MRREQESFTDGCSTAAGIALGIFAGFLMIVGFCVFASNYYHKALEQQKINRR